MLKWSFKCVSINGENVNLKTWSLEIVVTTKDKLQVWHSYLWVIFENVIAYVKDWKTKYFLARNFKLESKNDDISVEDIPF